MTTRLLQAKVRQAHLAGPVILATSLKIISAGAAFALTLLIARTMDKSQAGASYLFITAFNIASILGRFGMGNLVLRSTATDPSNAARILRSAFGFSAFASLIFGLLALLALGLGSFSTVGSVWLVAAPLLIGASAASVSTIGAFALRGLGRGPLSVWVQSGAIPSGVCVVCIVLWRLHGALDVASLSYAYAAVAIATGICVVLLGPYRLLRTTSGSDSFTPFRVARSAVPLAVLEAIQVGNQWVPGVLLAGFIDVTSVADYHVASRLAFLAHFLMVGVTAIVSPRLARLYRSGELDALQTLYRRASALSVGLSIVPLSLLIVWPSLVLSIFGEGYGGVGVLRILVVGQIVNMACGPVNTLLIMSSNEDAARNAGIVGAIIAIILGGLLAPVFGAHGVAAGVASSLAAQNLVGLRYANIRLGVSLFDFGQRAKNEV